PRPPETLPRWCNRRRALLPRRPAAPAPAWCRTSSCLEPLQVNRDRLPAGQPAVPEFGPLPPPPASALAVLREGRGRRRNDAPRHEWAFHRLPTGRRTGALSAHRTHGRGPLELPCPSLCPGPPRCSARGGG